MKRPILAIIAVGGLFLIASLFIILVGGDHPPTGPAILNKPTSTPLVATSRISPITLQAASPTIQQVTPSPAASPTITTVALIVTPTSLAERNHIPGMSEGYYTLPAGLGLSEGAKSCPVPLPIEKIKADYLAYWEALKQAYMEGNPDILKPHVDQQAQGGKEWEGKKNSIENVIKYRATVEYQVVHSEPLVVKVYPYSYKDCYIKVIDAVKLTSYAWKKGTREPLNDKQPIISAYPPDQAFLMRVVNGIWVIAGEGADQI